MYVSNRMRYAAAIVLACASVAHAQATPEASSPSTPGSAAPLTSADAGVPDETAGAPAAPTSTTSESTTAPPDAASSADAEPASATTPAAAQGPGAPKTICEGRTIKRIVVKGTGRASGDDIRATIRVRETQPCLDADITRDVQALWDMGYFEDVRVEADEVRGGVALRFVVRERPAVRAVEFTGQDEVDKSDIEEKVTLAEGSILSLPTLNEQLQKIRDLYAEKGFFLAQVHYELEKRPNNEVVVRFVIDEGDEVTVRRIRFIGNENLSEDDLHAIMQTSETKFFSFLSSGDTYRREVFNDDVTRVQALYYDHGYLAVEVSEPHVELTPDRHYVDVTIPVVEGPRFKVRRLKALEIDDRGAEITPLMGRRNLRDSIHLNPGDWFSRSVIAKDIEDIRRWYRDRGYAKVEITPQTELDMKTERVDVAVTIRRGPLVYVQRINMKGNDKTRDEVLRREARIVEGQLYSQTLVERSKERIEALGYFEKVNVSEEDGATFDRIVINFEVTERPTGTFQLGAGFSSTETFLLQGQVQQENLFGRGQSLAFNLSLSGISQLAQIRFVEPYLYGSDWTMAIELFKSLRQQRTFNRDSNGGNLTFGHPIFEDLFDDRLRLFVNYHLESVDITPGTGSLFRGSAGAGYYLYDFVPLRNLFRSGLTSSFRLTLSWDTRNNRLFPTEGVLAQASTELSDQYTLSDSNFVRHRVNFRGYEPLIGPLVGKLNVEWGLITSRDGIGVPIYERYFLGGITDVRGFPLQSLGPRLSTASSYNNPAWLGLNERGQPFGGNMQLYYNLEVEFPIIEAVGIKGVVFQDAGNAWNLEDSLCGPDPLDGDPATKPCEVDLTRLRTSWGFGIRWFSPLGPLRFEWGFPFSKRPYEDSVEFQFTVGNAF